MKSEIGCKNYSRLKQRYWVIVSKKINQLYISKLENRNEDGSVKNSVSFPFIKK
jgi:hypothetical protein